MAGTCRYHVVSHGSGDPPAAGFDAEALRRACTVTRPGGTVIVLVDRPVSLLPDGRTGELADDAALDRLPREAFGPRLQPLAFSELVRLHERRDWPLPPREIQWRVKALRGEFYRRRCLMAAERCHIVFSHDAGSALEEAIATCEGEPHILVLPEERTPLPKIELHRAAL